jgi:hypothetical protein
MTKHSKHGNARPFQSQAERERIRRIKNLSERGECVAIPFGHCCMSLKPAKVPMISAQGQFFDKDTVIESIVAKRSEIKDAAFPLAPNASKASSSTSNSKDLIAEAARANAFWISPNPISGNHAARQQETAKNDTGVPRCPVTGVKLRLKDLVPVKLESTTDRERDEGVYCCAVSKKPIGHNQAIFLRPSGIVVLESVFLGPNGTRPSICPVSGFPLGESDVIRLQKGRPLA